MLELMPIECKKAAVFTEAIKDFYGAVFILTIDCVCEKSAESTEQPSLKFHVSFNVLFEKI